MQPRLLLVRFVLFCVPTFSLSAAAIPLELGGDAPETIHIDAQTACPHGITLQGPQTTVSFGSLFPLGGPIDLQGGTLRLEQDLHAASGATLHTAGVIEGNNHLVSLPSSSEQLLPVTHCCSGIKKVFPCLMDNPVGGVAWQRNHERPLLGVAESAADGSLVLGWIEDERFIADEKVALPAGGRLLSWAPYFDGGIVGVEPYEEGSSLLFFTSDRDGLRGGMSLVEIGDHRGMVTAAAWDTAGERVAVAVYEDEAAAVFVYRLEEGALMQQATITAPGNAKIYDLAWNDTGTRLAAGFGYALGQPELITYAVTSEGIEQQAATSIAAHISSVSYFPTDGVEDEFIVVGLAGGGGVERIRLYHEQGSTLISPVHGGQYPVAHDVYDMSWSPDGRFLAMIAHTGVTDEVVRETEVVMYERRGSTLFKRLAHTFAVPRYQVSWAPFNERAVLALDSEGGVTQLALHECMRVRDVTISSGAASAWQVPLHVAGTVVWESASRGSVSFDKGIQVAPDSRFVVRNSLITGDAHLEVRGDTGSEVVLEECSTPRLGMHSSVPVRLSNQVRVSGILGGSFRVSDGATLQLSADASIKGILTVEGEAMIKGQGHQFAIDNMLLVMKPGSSLTFRDVTVRGLYGGMLKLSADSVLTFDRGTCVCFDEVALTEGRIVLKEQSIVYQGVSHAITAAEYEAKEDSSLLAVARKSSVSASKVATKSSPDDALVKPVVMPQPPAPSVQPVPPVAQHSAGGKTISSATYTVTSDMVASVQEPLTITKDCIIYGGGRTISCQPGAFGVIRVAPGIHVQFQRTHLLGMSPEAIEQGLGSSVTWGEGTVLSFANGGELRQDWRIQGAVSFFGNGMILHMRPGGGLRVDEDSALLLDSLKLSGVAGYAISLLSTTSSLVLSNSDIQLFGDWMLDQGSVQVRYDSTIRGPHTLLYSSDAQSVIAQHATLRLADGLYFSYRPASGRTDGFIAQGSQASLYIDGATLGTSEAAWHYVQGRLLLGGTLEGFGGGIVLSDPLGGTQAKVIQRQPVVHWAGSVAL